MSNNYNDPSSNATKLSMNQSHVDLSDSAAILPAVSCPSQIDNSIQITQSNNSSDEQHDYVHENRELKNQIICLEQANDFLKNKFAELADAQAGFPSPTLESAKGFLNKFLFPDNSECLFLAIQKLQEKCIRLEDERDAALEILKNHSLSQPLDELPPQNDVKPADALCPPEMTIESTLLPKLVNQVITSMSQMLESSQHSHEAGRIFEILQPDIHLIISLIDNSDLWRTLSNHLTAMNDRLRSTETESKKLQEIITRQTRQLTQLTMQVTDCQADSEEKIKLQDQIAVLESQLLTLQEANVSLEKQLEENNLKVGQVFEMQCALQELRLRLKDYESKIEELHINTHALSQPLSQISDLSSSSTTTEEEAICSETTPHQIQEASTVTDVIVAESSSSNVDVSMLELQIQKCHEETEKARKIAEEALQSKERMHKKFERDLLDMKTILRHERNARREAEEICQDLMARSLEETSGIQYDVQQVKSKLELREIQSKQIRQRDSLTSHTGLVSSPSEENNASSASNHSDIADIEEVVNAQKIMINILKEKLAEKNNILAQVFRNVDGSNDYKSNRYAPYICSVWASNKQKKIDLRKDLKSIFEETITENSALRELLAKTTRDNAMPTESCE